MLRDINKKQACQIGKPVCGGPEEIRTPDPYNANVMRSQLRYGPVHPAIIPPAPGIVKQKVAGKGRRGFGDFTLFFFGNLW